MVTAILAIVAGLIAALPMILNLIEKQTANRTGEQHVEAKEDSDLLDSVLRPPPPGGMS